MLLPDGPACLLAYGEFRSTTLSGMWAQLLPHLVRDLMPVLILYAVSSFVTERPYCRVLGVALYILGVLLLLPNYAVMGAFGPAHVAVTATMRTIGLLLICIVIKALLTPAHPSSPPVRAVCTRCGYDTSRCVHGRCSECGCGLRADTAPPLVKARMPN